MKNLLLLLACVLLAAACGTTKKISHRTLIETVVRDSVVLRDSVIKNTVFEYRDSVIIRDSIVLVVDSSGKVIESRKTRDILRSKNNTRESASETSARKDHTGKTSRLTETNNETTVKRGIGCIWDSVLGLVCGAALAFVIYSIKKIL